MEDIEARRKLTKARSLFDVSFVTEGANGLSFNVFKSLDSTPENPVVNKSLNSGGDSNMEQPKTEQPKTDNPQVIIPTPEEIKKMSEDQIRYLAVKEAGHLGDSFMQIEKLGTYTEASARMDEIQRKLAAGEAITSDNIAKFQHGDMTWDDLKGIVEKRRDQRFDMPPQTQIPVQAHPIPIQPTPLISQVAQPANIEQAALLKIASGIDAIASRVAALEQNQTVIKGAGGSSPEPRASSPQLTFTETVLKTFDDSKNDPNSQNMSPTERARQAIYNTASSLP